MRQSLGHLGGLYLDQNSWVGFEEGRRKWRRNIRQAETEEKQQHIVCGPPVTEAAGLTSAPVWKPRLAANTVQHQKGAADSTTSRQPDPDPDPVSR